MGAWYEGQDCSGRPDHFVSRVAAEQMKAEGDARSINSGKGILILRAKPAESDSRNAVSNRGAWRVVNQTAKPNVFHKPSRFGPGFPQYELT